MFGCGLVGGGAGAFLRPRGGGGGGGGGVQYHALLNSSLDGREWPEPRPGRLTHGGSTPVFSSRESWWIFRPLHSLCVCVCVCVCVCHPFLAPRLNMDRATYIYIYMRKRR